MNRTNDNPKFVQRNEDLELEPELREAIGNFKSSLDAWSDNALSRPCEIAAPARVNWTRITRWALGCAVFIGTVSSGIYENHRQQEAAKVEAARIAEQQRELVAQHAKEEADLMAKVDSDIAREVPSALEPLASLMDENQGTGN
ncbi:MAG: hypothetical protein JST28_01345 [Acidobacteria bacterium]|nr:hypothetical protein [Acidobacteriota bacterium]